MLAEKETVLKLAVVNECLGYTTTNNSDLGLKSWNLNYFNGELSIFLQLKVCEEKSKNKEKKYEFWYKGRGAILRFSQFLILFKNSQSNRSE